MSVQLSAVSNELSAGALAKGTKKSSHKKARKCTKMHKNENREGTHFQIKLQAKPLPWCSLSLGLGGLAFCDFTASDDNFHSAVFSASLGAVVIGDRSGLAIADGLQPGRGDTVVLEEAAD